MIQIMYKNNLTQHLIEVKQVKRFKDGTIEVDPNLSPIEREKTIAHERKNMFVK